LSLVNSADHVPLVVGKLSALSDHLLHKRDALVSHWTLLSDGHHEDTNFSLSVLIAYDHHNQKSRLLQNNVVTL
jgi:hypothetical protein